MFSAEFALGHDVSNIATIFSLSFTARTITKRSFSEGDQIAVPVNDIGYTKDDFSSAALYFCMSPNPAANDLSGKRDVEIKRNGKSRTSGSSLQVAA